MNHLKVNLLKFTNSLSLFELDTYHLIFPLKLLIKKYHFHSFLKIHFIKNLFFSWTQY
jgi:hypothetical protein